jgi:hypothetical protein
VRLVKSAEMNLRERSLRELAQIAQGVACCKRCPLYIDATQAVVGEGPAPAAWSHFVSANLRRKRCSYASFLSFAHLPNADAPWKTETWTIDIGAIDAGS